MPDVTYNYAISTDFPGGKINPGKLDVEIRRSAIATSLRHVATTGNTVAIVFAASLSVGDKTLLDGDVAGPAGGLIAAHDNTASPSSAIFTWPKAASVGDRALMFSLNWCDKTTWYHEAVKVTAAALGTGDGVQTVFNSTHTNLIDLRHGKVSGEDSLVPTAAQGGGSFEVAVRVDGVTKTEREFGETGGDYTVNYTTGAVTFSVAPANGAVIVADYFYSPADAGSTHIVNPIAGKKLLITDFEIYVSKNLVLEDEVRTAVYIYNSPPSNPVPKIQYPGTLIRLKTSKDFINWTYGNYPPLPAFGGSVRGVSQDILQMRYAYPSPIELDSAYGAELRCWLTHHRPFTGEAALVTFYGFVP